MSAPIKRAPIELSIYDSDDEEIKKLSRVVIPYGILKRSLKIIKRIVKLIFEAQKAELSIDNLEFFDLGEDDIDELTDAIIVIFGEDKITREEIESGADLQDIWSLCANLIMRAKSLFPNMPPAAK